MTTQEPSLRMQIHAYIRDHPAAHILEIAEAFELTHPTVMYHLELLADEGYIVSSIWGKRRVHFDTAAHYTSWEREVLALLAIDEARAIVERIASHPRTYPREIAQELGVSDTTVKRYVPEVLRLGMVSEVEGGFRRRLALARGFPKRAAAILEKAPRGSTAATRVRGLLPAAPAASGRAVKDIYTS